MTQTRMPSCIILSRQKLPTIDRGRYASADQLAKGAYVLADADGGDPELLLLATGSEVSLALGAHEQLAAEGVRSRVVSMPSWALFEQQPKSYRDAVLPPSVRARVAVEQASSLGWDRYVGPDGATVTMSTFGASAPFAKLQGEVRFHRCTRGRGGAKRNERGEGMMANRLHALEAEGQAVWLDLPRPEFPRRGRVHTADRAGRSDRRHLQSVDLREGDRPRQRI